jgi:hypothetical protein
LPATTRTGSASDSATATATATSSTEEPAEPSETEQIAAQVAEDFDATWRCAGCSTPQSEIVTGFADDLDPWDGSIEVYTDLYPDAEGREFFAPQVGAAVLAVAYPLGICKVDVMASDGTRLREHESQGRGC